MLAVWRIGGDGAQEALRVVTDALTGPGAWSAAAMVGQMGAGATVYMALPR